MYKILLEVWQDRLTPGGVIFTYICTRAFKVIRYPTTPDRSAAKSSTYPPKQVTDKLNELGEQGIQNLVDELLEIKRKTKVNLLKAYDNKDPIILERALSPAENWQHTYANREEDNPNLFPMLAYAAKQAGLDSFSIDVDIASGWSTKSIGRYGLLHIKRNWNIEDIILVSDYLTSPNDRQGPLESNEWICLNRASNGLVNIDVNDIRLENLPKKFINEIENHHSIKDLVEKLQKQANDQSSQRELPTRFITTLRPPIMKLTWNEKLKDLFKAKR